MLGKRWTKEEDDLVRGLWPRASSDIILSNLPNRNYDTIRQRAQKLGVRRCRTPVDRFNDLLIKGSVPQDLSTPCFLFQGRLDSGGYGQFTIDGRPVLAHRFAYEQAYGSIDKDKQVDHLCRVRHCCRVEHLELVSARTNTLRGYGPAAINARKTHCKHGHLLDRQWDKRRYCSICRKNKHLFRLLQREVKIGNVNKQEAGMLQLFKYTQQCVLENNWNYATILARGIIFDNTGNLIARGFPKFFNLHERSDTEPKHLPWAEGVEVYEKLDGSLIYIWFYNGRWHTSTNGSFQSDQAIAAKLLLYQYDLSVLDTTCTLLCEYVGPSNRIVVQYPQDELVILACMNNDWTEKNTIECDQIAQACGFRRPKRYDISHESLRNGDIPFEENAEGYVCRFGNGFRVKVKSPTYLRIHRLLDHLSPKGVVELIRGREYRVVLEQLPKEIAKDFDDVRAHVQGIYSRILTDAHNNLQSMLDAVGENSPRKDFAQWVQRHVANAECGFVFALLDGKDIEDKIWKRVLEEVKSSV